jgi:hypothetical protein
VFLREFQTVIAVHKKYASDKAAKLSQALAAAIPLLRPETALTNYKLRGGNDSCQRCNSRRNHDGTLPVDFRAMNKPLTPEGLVCFGPSGQVKANDQENKDEAGKENGEGHVVTFDRFLCR